MKHDVGNGEYDDDHYRWPQHPKEWMGHSAISIITTKVIFAFFLEGLLRVTDIIQNPLSMKATAFSENLLRKFDSHLECVTPCVYTVLIRHMLHSYCRD